MFLGEKKNNKIISALIFIGRTSDYVIIYFSFIGHTTNKNHLKMNTFDFIYRCVSRVDLKYVDLLMGYCRVCIMCVISKQQRKLSSRYREENYEC